MNNFYDKVAKKFGGYDFSKNKPKYFSVHLNGNPEEDFKAKLIEVSGIAKIALDVGCGDCKFAFSIANSFNKIYGIDTSKELLKIAESKKKSHKVSNVYFSLQNAEKTDFKNGTFDVIYCRRGPTFYKEYFRLLKIGGYYIEIDIGEKDTMELKKIFGRGQDYGKWKVSKSKIINQEMKQIGFTTLFTKDYFYNGYYLSPKEFDRFLLGVPIFEDYDSVKDKKFFLKYVQKFQTEKGIQLPRHRIVILAKKI